MKKLLFTLLIGISALSYAQAPQKISYQGVARTVSGTVLANQPIGIKFDIHQGSASGPVVFTETHTGVSTNGFGLFTTYIGSISNLAVINWATNSYFIEVSIDPNTGTFSSLGSQQLMSVPYALNAGSAPAPAVSFTNNILSVGGNTTTISAVTPTLNINLPNTIINPSVGVYSITIPSSTPYTLTANSNTLTIDNGTTISTATVPVASLYTLTANSNSISLNNGTSVSTVTVPVASLYTLTANSNTITLDNGITVTTATVPAYSAGTGISISASGVITNTTSSTSLPSAYNGQLLYNNGSMWDTIPQNKIFFNSTNTYVGIGTNNPAYNLHVVGTGAFLSSMQTPHVITNTVTVSGGTLGQVLTSDGSGNGTFQNLPAALTPTITSTGIAVVTPTTGNTFNVDVPVPVLSYTSGTNVLSLTQGTTVTTATLNSTGSTTVSIVGVGLATVTPTTGSTFTVSVPAQTLSVNNGSIAISGPGGNAVLVPTTTVVSTNTNISVSNASGVYSLTAVTPTLSGTGVTGSYPSYTINSTATQTLAVTGNSIVTSNLGGSATFSPAVLSYTGSTNTLKINDGVTSNTVLLNAYTAGTGISVIGTSPNFVITNTSVAVTPTISGTGLATVTPTVGNNFTVNVPAPGYNPTTGSLSFGTNTVIVAPTLALTGTTLTSGPATNSVNLTGFNGIYGGSGSIQTGSTTVTVGTNTLTFLSGNTMNKSITNFFGGGITGTHLAVGHIGTNPAAIKLFGSVSTTPVDYGYVSGSSNGIAISGGTSSNGFYATTNAEIGVGTFTTGTGKYVITHTASQSNPTMHLRETSGGLNRIKFSNNTVANKFFETAAQTNAVDGNGAYSINYFDGTTYNPVLLVTGERKVSVNNLNTVLASLHVMENATTAGGGVVSEGFARAGQINLIRNNQPALAARTAVIFGDELGRINFAGYDGVTYGDGAKIYAKASENITSTSKGTDMYFAIVPNATMTTQDIFKLGNDGIVTINPFNNFSKAALDIKGRLRVDSSLTMAAYTMPPSTSFGNEGRIYYDRPTNKFKVSENGGAYVDLIPGIGTSPWIQGAGVVSLTNATDNVGIGTTTPVAALDVTGNLRLSGSQLYLGAVGGINSGYTGMYETGTDLRLAVFKGGASGTGFAPGGNSIDAITIQYNTGNVGIGTTSPSSPLHVVHTTSTSIGSRFESTNSSSTFANIASITNGGGAAVQAANTGLGNAGLFFISNPSNNSAALDVSTNGGGTAIYASNSNTSNISAVIQANSNSSGVAIYANNTAGSTAQFDGSSTFNTFTSINSNASVNAYAGNFEGGIVAKGKTATSTGFAIKAFNTVSTELFGVRNDGHVGINATAPAHRLTVVEPNNTNAAIFASNTSVTSSSLGIGISGLTSNPHPLAAAIMGQNSGAGPSVFGLKGSASNGIAGRFEIQNTGNSADVVLAQTEGTGAAVHAIASATNASSALSLWLENGHLRSTGTTPTTGSVSVSGGGLTAAAPSLTNATDVKGKLTAIITTTTLVNPGNNTTIRVSFNKGYSVIPAVVVTPLTDLLGMSYFVTNVSTGSFDLTIKNNTVGSITTPLSWTVNFNYMVIE